MVFREESVGKNGEATKKVFKWSFGVCVTTVDDVVLGELGLVLVEEKLCRAGLTWAGVVCLSQGESIVTLCGQLDIYYRGRKDAWGRKMEKAMLKYMLRGEYVHTGNIAYEGEKERKEKVERWKERVKVNVKEVSDKLWLESMCVEVKTDIYIDLKAKPKFEPYLLRETRGV